MSCIAMIYIMPLSDYDTVVNKKIKEKEQVPSGILFFTWKKNVEVERIDADFIERNAVGKYEPNFSGFFITMYLVDILKVWDDFMEDLDDYFSTISYEKAVQFKNYLVAHPPDKAKLRDFCKKERHSLDPELEEDIQSFIEVHNILIKWAGDITSDKFGVMHLSY